MLKYFKGSIVTTLLGLLLVAFVSWQQQHEAKVAMQAMFTAILLAVLEISLSFDNAVVNATVMKRMSDVWRKRFLTWGILIAVFGMRLIFPVAIVSLLASMSPWEALMLSINDPQKYSEIMTSSHLYVSSFGGMFLFMVFVHFFFSVEKDTHWFPLWEKPMVAAANYNGIELVIAFLTLFFISNSLDASTDKFVFLSSGVWGIIVYLLVHGLADLLEKNNQIENAGNAIASAGLGTFLYLEILDASFSFDGVIGAFALTNSLFLIMVGLGIGAFFVRSLTIYFVEKNTVEQFVFLEHGAFYALGVLAMIMLADPVVHVPEWLTGLCGAAILAASVLYSIWHDKRKEV